MGNAVIVAIPQSDDPIWKISSEKVPHLTFLFLGPSENVPVEQIALFLEHAAKLSLTRFGLDVDRRGTLGPDNADVLFFQDNWELPRVREFRDLLLKEPNIRKAYDSVQQYGAIQEWTPHITLGYPTAPAKKSDDQLYWVQFDRVALWTGDYSGPEFQLQRTQYAEVAMTDRSAAGRQFLAHHGVLGMKWGHHRSSGPSDVKVVPRASFGKTRLLATGGGHHPPHPDAVKAAEHHQKLKKSGVAALSNKDLQDLQTRLQLESNVNRLSSETKSAGQKFASKLLADQGKQAASKYATDYINEQLKKSQR